MSSQSREVPYGRPNEAAAGPSVRVREGVPLRLAHGPYPFDEPPDLVRNATVAARMALIREHLKSLCGPWDKLAKLFLDAYFASVAASVAAPGGELVALARRSALFTPADWSFAALRPLPQAHLGEGARADIAFWTGARFAAIVIESGATPRKEERQRLERVAASGAELVRVPAAALAENGIDWALLPSACAEFWRGVALPASPFGPAALEEF